MCDDALQCQAYKGPRVQLPRGTALWRVRVGAREPVVHLRKPGLRNQFVQELHGWGIQAQTQSRGSRQLDPLILIILEGSVG